MRQTHLRLETGWQSLHFFSFTKPKQKRCETWCHCQSVSVIARKAVPSKKKKKKLLARSTGRIVNFLPLSASFRLCVCFAQWPKVEELEWVWWSSPDCVTDTTESVVGGYTCLEREVMTLTYEALCPSEWVTGGGSPLMPFTWESQLAAILKQKRLQDFVGKFNCEFLGPLMFLLK